MKILFINTLYSPNVVGGAERSVQFLAESLVQEGHEAVVLTTIAGNETKVDSLCGVKIYYIGIKNLYWQYQNYRDKGNPTALKPIWHAIDTYNPWMAEAVARIIDAEQPDLVHTNNLSGFSVSVWQVIKKRQLPLVHTLRDYYLMCFRQAIMFRNGKNCQTPCWDCKTYSLPRCQLSNLVDTVIGISQFILEQHLKQKFFTQVPVRKVIHNAYEAHGSPIAKSSRLRLGYLGRLDRTKGIDLLLQTLEKMSYKNWELKVGGQATDEQIAQFRDRYPLTNVDYLGFVKPEAFFSTIDVLIVPSIWQEPLGRTVIEAYAHGVPVIGSNQGGIPEIIEPGLTGFVFDPNQDETLIEAINRFIDNPALASQMRKDVLRKSHAFTPRQILQEYLEVYQTTASRVSSHQIQGHHSHSDTQS